MALQDYDDAAISRVAMSVAPTRRERNVPLIAAAVASAIVLGLLAIHLWAQPLPGMARLERFATDAQFRWRGPRAPATDRVVVVGIDDETRRAAPDLGPTRVGWARFIRALSGYGPSVIALDLFFSRPERILPPKLATDVTAAAAALAAEPSSTEATLQAKAALDAVVVELQGDTELAAAVKDAGTVVLGANFRLIDDGEAPTTAPREPVGLGRARHGEAVSGGQTNSRTPAAASAVDFTIAAIADGAAGAGAVNTYRDDDLVLRRVPLAITMGPHTYMGMGLAAAALGNGTAQNTSIVNGSESLMFGKIQVPLDRSASLPLDFPGRGRIPHISAAAVLDGTAPREALAGKIVFVGLTYSAFDKISTPLDPLDDGVDIHAILAENVLGGRLLKRGGTAMALFATLVMLAMVVLAQIRAVRRRSWLPAVIAGLAVLLWIALSYYAFVAQQLLIPVAAPAVAVVLVALVALLAGIATEGREKHQLRTAFSHYVSATVVERIMADPRLARLGGERRDLTVLFSDIRGFSAFSETMRPEALAGFLNEYLTPMTELVMASDGTLDKYIGDAVMAIWGAPIQADDHAERACATALAMQHRLIELNREWARVGKPSIAIGIGINSGPMAVGNMGSQARFDYTVMGDAVNLGARLEALTKEYEVGILCGPATARACRDRFVFRELGRVRVKGRAGAVPVFELLGAVGSPIAVDVAVWQVAMSAYQAGNFDEAAMQFASLAAAGDRTADILARRARELATTPPAPGWDGVYEQRSK